MIKPLLRRHSISTAAQFFEPAPSPTRAVIHQVSKDFTSSIFYIFIKRLLYHLFLEQKQCTDQYHLLSLSQEPTTKKICPVSSMTVSADASPDVAKKGILVQVCSHAKWNSKNKFNVW